MKPTSFEHSSYLSSSLKIEKGLSLVFAFFVLWFKHEKDYWANFYVFPRSSQIWKAVRAIFHVFSRSGFKYEKMVELTLDSFSRSGSNMKREVEFIFSFSHSGSKNENDTECILRCDHARKALREATSSLVRCSILKKIMEWRKRSLIFSRL